ncbi:alanine/glycine:cation symporter family protein [Streptococcus halichoeri]|uniref:alanine/glycine:cation symporter family protein n=1 Tax=Streptococcus halichoeri TaxID=254785 RepID=UPI001C8E438F|nr:sodium:alanine symporter family protein [Streptococcus halichoeri]
MTSLANQLDNLVWGPPLLILLVGTGLYYSIRLGFLQIKKLGFALTLILRKSDGKGDISSFAALATALAATVGTGNMVGVATAIKTGGPGALFWMCVAAFLGMATKYAEGVLAIKYRTLDNKGQVAGGPMYYITQGMGKKWRPLATCFAFFGTLVALFGIGTFAQVNAITSAVNHSFGLSPKWLSILLALLVALIIFGGIQSISKVAEKLVPFMAITYILATLMVICSHYTQLLPMLGLVFKSAFTPLAAMGGFGGALVKEAIQKGIARGVFSNEAGLGSAPIAAAAAKTKQPVEQGLVSMTGTFIDTIIICTLTGLAILVSGQWTSSLEGAPLTQAAFASIFGHLGQIAFMISLILFAFTTILGWSYYGERCFAFLAGSAHLNYFRLLFVTMVALGGYLKLDFVWILADIVNGLMAIPNLIALLALAPVVIQETQAYFHNHRQ